MVEPNPTATSAPALTPAPASEPEAYRPVSGLAIAGVVLAGLYVVLVVLVAGIGFFGASAIFLPGWTFLLPVGAAALCLLGQWQIRESEGTRAGLALTRWGLGLSIFAGGGYAAIQYATGLAVTQQAHHFLMVKDDADSGFFPRLQSGDPVQINEAFLLTVPEAFRRGADPKNPALMEKVFNAGKGGEGFLSKFRNNLLIRSIINNGKNVTIESLGVDKWSHDKEGYAVTRGYRVIAPEMTMEVLVPVRSSEGEQRKWHLDLPKIDFKKAFISPLGMALSQATESARLYLNKNWYKIDLNGNTDKTAWNTAAPGEPWQPIRDQIRNHFREGEKGRHKLDPASASSPEQSLAPWKVENDRLRLTLEIQYSFQGPNPVSVKSNWWMGGGTVVMEDQKPVVLDQRGLPEPASLAEPDWKVLSIEFKRLKSMEKMMPGPPTK
jgi:hypothetical protein